MGNWKGLASNSEQGLETKKKDVLRRENRATSPERGLLAKDFDWLY